MPRTALPSPIGRRPQLSTVRRRGLGGGARGLLRPLQPQHQLDQLFLAQTLKLATTHPTLESAKTASLKGVGKCAAFTNGKKKFNIQGTPLNGLPAYRAQISGGEGRNKAEQPLRAPWNQRGPPLGHHRWMPVPNLEIRSIHAVYFLLPVPGDLRRP